MSRHHFFLIRALKGTFWFKFNHVTINLILGTLKTLFKWNKNLLNSLPYIRRIEISVLGIRYVQ